MVNELQIKALKQLLLQLETDYHNYIIDDEEDFEVDYEDLKKEIFHIQEEIKAITENWEW